ncbi:S49 family peptidase [Caldiplasma sukawensis]
MIGKVNLYGNINERLRSQIIRQLSFFRMKKDTKAIILEINSGGGTASDSEILYDYVKNLNRVKPVVTLVSGMCASGAYMVACGTSQIYSINSSVIGSIGVISIIPDFSGLLEKLGIKIQESYLGENKKYGLPLSPIEEEAKEERFEIIKDFYNYFLSVVSKERKISSNDIQQIGKSGIYSAVKAKNIGLVDEVGEYSSLIERIKGRFNEKNDPYTIPQKLPLIMRLIDKFM